MSDTAYTNNSSATSFSARVSGALESFSRYRRARKMYRNTFNSLNELSDRELRDIGLSRGEIRRVADESASLVK